MGDIYFCHVEHDTLKMGLKPTTFGTEVMPFTNSLVQDDKKHFSPTAVCVLYKPKKLILGNVSKCFFNQNEKDISNIIANYMQSICMLTYK